MEQALWHFLLPLSYILVFFTLLYFYKREKAKGIGLTTTRIFLFVFMVIVFIGFIWNFAFNCGRDFL
ncbi:MAG: hypothetical protein ACOX3T_08545 [Bdellovibrionota bacterium]